MEGWNLAIVAVVLIGFAAVSARLRTTAISSAMVFVTVGLVVGPHGLGWVQTELNADVIRIVAEITLTFVLFTDASRLDLRALRRDYPVPARLLGIGLPLTIVAGTVAAKLIWPDLPWLEAAALGVILAPTDAALGQAVVTDPNLPQRISQGLNVESGLNDGICVPLLFVILAAATAENHANSTLGAVRLVAEEIGYGALGGLVAGGVGVALIHWGTRTGYMDKQWKAVAGLATAGLAYGIAAALGGSGFIAAFVGGLVFSWYHQLLGDDWRELLEGAGGVFDALTFFAFGAVVLGSVLADLDWRVVLYAVASLTVVRMVPVALAMIGSRARWPTVLFEGWFGPRGLASIVFVVIVINDGQLGSIQLLTLVATATVALSVYAHGATAVPLTARYAAWYRRHPDRASLMEHEPVTRHRWRRHAAAAPPSDMLGQDGGRYRP